MAIAQPVPPTEVAILTRLLENGRGKMSPALARHVLTLGFDADDQARMAYLATRNQAATQSSGEREELAGYVRVAHLLALLQSKARRALRIKLRA